MLKIVQLELMATVGHSISSRIKYRYTRKTLCFKVELWK